MGISFSDLQYFSGPIHINHGILISEEWVAMDVFWRRHQIGPIPQFLFFLISFLLLFNYSCLPFLPFPPPTPAEPTSLPHPHHPPRYCPCVLYNSSCNPLFPLSPPHSPQPLLDCSPPQCLWLQYLNFFRGRLCPWNWQRDSAQYVMWAVVWLNLV